MRKIYHNRPDDTYGRKENMNMKLDSVLIRIINVEVFQFLSKLMYIRYCTNIAKFLNLDYRSIKINVR